MRSRDVTAGLVLIAACLAFMGLSSEFYMITKQNFVAAFSAFNWEGDYAGHLGNFLRKVAMSNFLVLLPVLGVSFLAALLSPFLFGGWNYSGESVAFNFSKLNPITNLMRLFSPIRIGFELLKSFCKFLFLLAASIGFIYFKREAIVQLMRLYPLQAAHNAYEICVQFVFCMLLVIIVICLMDALYQQYAYLKQAKMTTQEIKDEYKDSEGSGDVKRKQRSAQVALLKQRLSIAVPRSTVIVTNPTHYAVAIRYLDSRDSAPIVLAKGTDQMAQQIRYYAIANAIPIYEAPVLARAIFHTSKIGHEIKPGLYMAMAIVLSYVNQLKRYQMGLGPQPKHTELEIPKEYIYEQ